MAGQKARIDKDSNGYLTGKARPEGESETAYKDNKDLENVKDPGDEPDTIPANYKGTTKKDRTRRADQTTTGTEGDMGSALERMEDANPFSSVLKSRFFSEAENPSVASAPATSDSPSLGMMAVNNTDFRPPQTDVRNVLESIALQAAETFEMLDENSSVPDSITNELSNTAKAISKIYEYVSKTQNGAEADPLDTSPVSREPASTKAGVNEGYAAASNRAEASRQRAIKRAAADYKRHGDMDRALRDHDLVSKNDAAKIRAHLGEEVEELDELSKYTLSSYARKAMRQAVNAQGYQSNYDKEGNFKGAEREMKHKWKRIAGVDRAIKKLAKEEVEDLDEKLIGGQKKIDKNHNGRLDAHDFKLLRAKKTMKEATDIVFQELLRGKFDDDY